MGLEGESYFLNFQLIIVSRTLFQSISKSIAITSIPNSPERNDTRAKGNPIGSEILKRNGDT